MVAHKEGEGFLELGNLLFSQRISLRISTLAPHTPLALLVVRLDSLGREGALMAGLGKLLSCQLLPAAGLQRGCVPSCELCSIGERHFGVCGRLLESAQGGFLDVFVEKT